MNNIIDVYDTDTKEYLHSFINTDTNIADYVASLKITDRVELISVETDEFILSTMGNFLDVVPNQKWLVNNLLPLLVPRQRDNKKIKKVETLKK